MRNKNKIDRSGLVNVILSYNGKENHITVNKYKQLNYIKNKIYQFYQIGSDIYIKYKNIDYSAFLEEKIGFLFLNKSVIKLVITPKKENINKLNNNQKQKNLSNVKINVNNENTNNETLVNNRYENSESNINNSKYSKYGKFKLPPITKNLSSMTDENISSINDSNSPTKLKSLNYSSNATTTKKIKPYNFYDINNILKNVYKLKDICSFKNCVECLKKQSVYYCRSCNKFICEACKNKNHNTNIRKINTKKNKIKNIEHLLLKINYDNINETILNYKNLLIKKFIKPYNYWEFTKDELNDIQEQKWKNEFDMKINDLINKTTDIKEEKIDGLNYNIKKDEINNIKKYINEYNCSSKENPYKLFKELSEKDKILNNMIKTDNKNISMVKIYNMFDEIENEIDKVLFDLEEKI